MKNSMRKRVSALLLALVMVACLLPTVVVAEDDTAEVSANDCVIIGEYMGGNVYYYAKTVPSTAQYVCFTDYEPDDVEMISGLVGGYSEGTNTAALSATYSVPAEFAGNDDWEAADGYEDFDFTGRYLYWLFDADYESTCFVLDAPENGGGDTGGETAATLKAYDGDTELPVSVTEDGYEYYDYMGGGSQTTDLYTVMYSPLGADAVTLDFGENLFICYGYDAAGEYQASYGNLSGQKSILIPDLEYCVWVQTPYSEDWTTGGDMQFVVCFKPMFTAAVHSSGEALSEIALEKGGYQYKSYFGTVSTVDLYTITLPFGTEEIDFTFADNCLAYNYRGEGTNPVFVDDTTPDAFLGGAVTDYINGSAEYSRKTDANSDGILDYIQVQDTYNEDYSGADLRYAIAFTYLFEAAADGEKVTDITSQEGGYTPQAYDPVTWEPIEGTPVTLYTVALPDGAEEVVLTFPEGVLAYNYTADGQTYIAGNYDAEQSGTGVTSAAVSPDANGDGVPDCIQIQTPFDENYNSDVLYAVTFDKVGGSPSDPFEVTVDGEKVTDITSQEGGYTPQAYDPVTWEPIEGTPVTLYTVTLPEGAEEVVLTFPEGVLAYNYTADGQTYIAGNYDAEQSSTGVTSAAVSPDANSDGVPDCIQIQTPFDENYNSDVLYAITFDKVGDVIPEGPDAEQLRENIAAAFAASDAASDPNAPWIAADMAAYQETFPQTENVFTEEQKQGIINKAITAIASATSPSDVAKYIIALAALKIDPTQLKTADLEPLNAVEKLDSLCFGDDGALTNTAKSIYAIPYIIIAYQQFSDCSDQIDALKAAAVESADSWLDTTWGTDSITPMLLALAPYYGESDIKAAIDKGVAAVTEAQAENGSLGNAASTGLAMAGLAAIGTDPAGFKNEGSGKSLADGLATFADESESALMPTGNSFSTEQGFRGLVALANAASGAYRIYDFSGNEAERVPAAASPEKTEVIFSVTPEDASVTVTDTLGNEVECSADNDKLFIVGEGSYAYSVKKDGYSSESGQFEVSGADVASGLTKTITAALTASSQGDKITVAVTVEKLTVDGKYIVEPTLIELDGQQLASVVTRDLLKDHYQGIYDGTPYKLKTGSIFYLAGVYDKDIQGFLSEMDHGSQSGWMFCINNSFSSAEAAAVILKDGDVIRWQYSCEGLGSDIGSDNSAWGSESSVTVADKDALIWKMAEINRDGTSAKYGKAYDNAMTVLQTIEAPQADVDAALAALKAAEEQKPVDPYEEGTFIPFNGDKPSNNTSNTGSSNNTKPQAQELKFRDVSEGDWYYDAVKWALEEGITTGTSSTTFSPDDSCLREQIVTFLWRAAGSPKATAVNPFVDVKPGDYFYDAVLWAYEKGITKGVDDTHFGVGEPCLREQVVTFLWRAAGKPAAGGTSTFTDVEQGKYYAEAVNWAVNAGITVGMGDGRFGVGQTCTRGQIVTFLYRSRKA